MKRSELIRNVRSITRDLSNAIFREQDIIDFLNEGINRFKQVIPDLKGVPKLLDQNQEPHPIPEEYQHLLSVYSASRCFMQDERHYQSSSLMNEFETKLDELKQKIDSGDIVIVDPNTGEAIDNSNSEVEYVDLKSYWGKQYNDEEGVY